MDTNIIELNNICKSYSNGKEKRLVVLKDVSLTIKAGEMTAIIGRSGSGKSTLLNILGCTDRFDGGTYLFFGKDISKASDKKLSQLRGSHISFVFQDYALIEDESVLSNVETPLYFDRSIKIGKMKKMAMQALKTIGIQELSSKKVNQLSGGQKQRVAIARAIVNKPELILADEPTGALDSNTAEEIIEMLRGLNEEGTTVIIVTHDMYIAQKCERVLNITNGKVEELYS